MNEAKPSSGWAEAKPWSEPESESPVGSSDLFYSRPSPYRYVVVIDEVGVGYAEPCCSRDAAERAAKILRSKGYNVIIKRL